MPSLKKAQIKNLTASGQPTIFVLVNPEQYTFTKDINYAQAGVPGLSGPILQFVHGNLETLELELFLDTYEQGTDVRPLVRQLTDLMNIDPATHAPPVLQFTWGTDSSFTDYGFTCVLSRVNQRFILFLPEGTPVRARVLVTFSQYTDPDLAAQAQKNQTADYSQLYVVHQGDTLSAIAAHVYEDPTTWRPIALINQIDDPRVLDVGRRLLVPRLPYRDPETGEVLQ